MVALKSLLVTIAFATTTVLSIPIRVNTNEIAASVPGLVDINLAPLPHLKESRRGLLAGPPVNVLLHTLRTSVTPLLVSLNETVAAVATLNVAALEKALLQDLQAVIRLVGGLLSGGLRPSTPLGTTSAEFAQTLALLVAEIDYTLRNVQTLAQTFGLAPVIALVQIVRSQVALLVAILSPPVNGAVKLLTNII